MKTILFLMCLSLFPTYSTAQDLLWNEVERGYRRGSPVTFAVQDSFLFAGCGSEGVYRTADKGKTWKEVDNGLPVKHTGDGYSVSALFSHEGILFMGTYKGRVYRSINNGENWKEMGKGLPVREIRNFGAVGSTLFVATAGGAGIYRSTDKGETWTESTKGVQAADTIMHCFATIGNTIVAGGGAMYRSTDQGVTWTERMRPNSAEFYTITSRNNTFYTCSSNYGVAQSTDDGITWNCSRNGLDVYWLQHMIVTEKIIIVAGFSEYYISNDNGKNWIKSPDMTFRGRHIENFTQMGTLVFAGAGDAILRTELSTNVEEIPLLDDGITLAPNPTSTTFTITGIDIESPKRIVNTLGMEVKSWNVGNVFDISDVPSGVYFVQLRTPSGMMCKPIVVTH